MPCAHLCFQVPEDYTRIAEIIDGWAGESSELGTPAADAENGLAAKVGTAVTVSFDDEEPIYPIDELIKVLSAQGARYLGVFDAMVERSRGLRVEGRALFNTTGKESDARELTIPWVHGRPELDERTLVAAGLTKQDAAEVIQAVLSAEPTTAPDSHP